MATNFEPNECVIFVRSTKIGTHKNKAIHSNSQTTFTSTLESDYVTTHLLTSLMCLLF